jgi:LPS-assembly lipoprotein
MNQTDTALQATSRPGLRQRMVARRLRGFVALGLILSLAACGFELRKTPEFAFNTLYTEVGATSALGTELKRSLAAVGNIQLITDAAQAKNAQVILDILQEQREKTVVGMTPSGQVREFQLRLRLRFRLRTPQGKELIPDTELLQQRDQSYDEAFALSKQAEEELLYRTMQSDIVQQILRRLAAVKEL